MGCAFPAQLGNCAGVWLLIAAVSLTACGRVGFDVRVPGDGGAADGAGSDARAYTVPMLVATGENRQASSATNTVSVPATAAGDLVVAAVLIDNGVPIGVSGVQDAAGSVYVSAGARGTASGLVTEIWYAANSHPGATDVVVTLSTIANASNVWVVEFSGIDTTTPLNAAATIIDGTASSPLSGPQVATSLPNELVVSLVDTTSGVLGPIVAGSPFSALPTLSGDDTAYAVATTPGTYAPTWTLTSGGGALCGSTAAFKPASL